MLFKNNRDLKEEKGTYVVLSLREALRVLESGCELVEIWEEENERKFAVYFEYEFKEETKEKNRNVNMAIIRGIKNEIRDEKEIQKLRDDLAEDREKWYMSNYGISNSDYRDEYCDTDFLF